jgi:hypothetical protein
VTAEATIEPTSGGAVSPVALRFHVIGESHSDGLIAATIHDAASGALLALADVEHIPSLLTEDFVDEAGRLGVKIAVALIMTRLLAYTRADAPEAIGHHEIGPNLLSPEWAPHWRITPGMEAAPILFVAGNITARVLTGVIPTTANLNVPRLSGMLAHVPGFEPTANVSEESIVEIVERFFAPMYDGLRLLRRLGFRSLYLHSLDPCTLDDEHYRQQTGFDTRALTRYKMLLLCNASIAAFCAREGIGFIDRWNDLTEGGAVREGYLLDAVHLRAEHMRPSALSLYEAIAGKGRSLAIR